jgi:hypothetical protein
MKTKEWLSFAAIAVTALALGLAGIGWGLPSARRVALLGGCVEKVRVELGPRSSRDMDSRRGQAAILAARPAEAQPDLARWVRRYLLFSDSPDEPLTLMALANMRPRQFDFNPRMVEYGGLHVYGTGAALALAHASGGGRITGDVAHYADRPGHIAGLYIAGRFLMALYNAGIALLLFCFAGSVAARMPQSTAGSARLLCGWAAALMWLLSPPSLAFSHVINPHLPAAFYATLAVWLAWRAGDELNVRCWLGAAAASGAAAACALNAALSFLMLPAAAFFAAHAAESRPKAEFQTAGGWRAGLKLAAGLCGEVARPLGLAALVAAAVYGALNPYWLANVDVLREEMARFRQFRSPMLGVESVFAFCFGPLPHAIGLPGLGAALFGAATAWQTGVGGRAVVCWAAAALLGTAWLAGSDAAEALSVRFAIFVLPSLCVLAVAALLGPWPGWARGGAAAFIALGCAVAAAVHLASFMGSPRDDAGEFINRELPAGCALPMPASPGPYEMPAFDFSRVRPVMDATAPHEFLARVEDRWKPVAPAGFEWMAGFSPAGAERLVRGMPENTPPPTPLSFSGRSVRVYRKQAPRGK